VQTSADDGQHHEDLAHDDPNTVLIVSGPIYPDHASDIAVEVRRGMMIVTSEGHEAGRVAAVIVDKSNQRVTHVLLSRLNHRPDYRLVPISLIEQVFEEQVLLRIFNQVVNTLPAWHSS
jgi:sporulation protein YlmC with PRC-barrel domain